MKSQKSYEASGTGQLFLVPTPIGNLKDMTFRAVEVLNEVDYIAAEDTRHTLKLLNHFNIQTPLLSYHEHNKIQKTPEIIQILQDGQDVALVSDAGTPIISDPGYELLQACLDASIDAIPLPGANAAVSALIASGLPAQPFYFYGFLSHRSKERKEELETLNTMPATLIFYESPHRLKAMLKDAVEILGGDRQVALARELTKQYEEILRGRLDEALDWSHSHEVRGEFCVVVEAGREEDLLQSDQLVYISYADHVQMLIDQEDMRPKDAIKEVALLHNVAKRLVYNEFHDLT